MRIPEHIESLQAQGRYSFSYPILLAASGKQYKAVERALSRLRKGGAIANPRKGFYVIVPPEYRISGCLPASWFIDDMMKFMEENYYVGLLSAAELYGSAHHRPQELQVVAERSHRAVECGRARIRFFSKRCIEKTPVAKHKTRTGYMLVSTPEATSLDLVRYSFELGGLSAVAVTISELTEHLKPRRLVRAAEVFDLSVSQRLGFLLDRLGKQKLADQLSAWVLKQRPRLALLRSDGLTGAGLVDQRWRLRVNAEVAVEA